MPDPKVISTPQDRGKSAARVSSSLLHMAVMPIAAAGVAGAAYTMGENIVTRSLREDATGIALSWRNHFSGGFTGLDQVTRHGWLDPQQRDFIAANTKIGRVFRFRLFDARGRLVLQSDKAGAPPVDVALRDHDEGAVKAIQNRILVVDVIENENAPGLPAVYAEAHVPLLASDGEVAGLVEVHIDQTRTAGLFRQALHVLMLSLAALIAAAVLGFSLLSSIFRGSAGRLAITQDDEVVPGEPQPVEHLPAPQALPNPVVKPVGFDNWLARVAEDAAQDIPEKVALECHLGLGDAVLPFDEEQMGRLVTGLVANAATAILATADGADNAVVLAPRVILKTSFTSRGVELSISDNRLGPVGSQSGFVSECHRLLQKLGGGFDVNDLRGQGATFTAWWPLNATEQAAA